MMKATSPTVLVRLDQGGGFIVQEFCTEFSVLYSVLKLSAGTAENLHLTVKKSFLKL